MTPSSSAGGPPIPFGRSVRPTSMSARRGLLSGIAVALALAATPAHASELRCSEWQRLGDGQKEARLVQRLDEVERGPELRQLRIGGGALHRCLEYQTERIRL